MNTFEEVRMTWKGVDYSIAPDRVMRCIAAIEDVVTLAELESFLSTGRVPLGKIAMAFGVVLRFAGVSKVNDAEIYNEMFKEKDGVNGEDPVYTHAIDAVQKLLVIMVPPEYIAKKLESQQEVKGKKN